MVLHKTNILERKIKFELAIKIYDEAIERLKKYRSNYVEWVMTESYLDEEARKNFKENFEKRESPFWQRGFAIHKERMAEFIKLLDFLYLKFGSYKVDVNEKLHFSTQLDNQLYHSFIEKINNLLDEDDEINLRIQKKRKNLFGL